MSLEQGIFPNIMKKAEVIPLYKGKERDLCMNYRPISLLLTVSKILEKLMYKRMYEFSMEITYSITVNMVSDLNTAVKM